MSASRLAEGGHDSAMAAYYESRFSDSRTSLAPLRERVGVRETVMAFIIRGA